jgi:hypothetical protein
MAISCTNGQICTMNLNRTVSEAVGRLAAQA